MGLIPDTFPHLMSDKQIIIGGKIIMGKWVELLFWVEKGWENLGGSIIVMGKLVELSL